MDADAVRVKLSWTQRDHLPRIALRFVRFWTLREETSSSSKKSSSCESCESSPFSHAYCLIEALSPTHERMSLSSSLLSSSRLRHQFQTIIDVRPR
jgi:hypothetical protein